MTTEVTAAAKDNSAVARNRITVVRPMIHKDAIAMTIAMMRTKDRDERIAGLATTQTVLAQLIAAMKVIGKTTAADQGLVNATGTTGDMAMRAATIEC